MTVRPWSAPARGVLLAILLVRAPELAAQDAPVAVKRLGAARVVVESGGLATLTFRVVNRSDVPLTVQGRLTLPPEWRLAIPAVPLALAANGSELQLLRIALPARAAAGTYTVRYGAGDAGASDSVSVTVPEHRAVTVRVRDVPRFVTAGAAYDVLFDVRNGGNAPVVVHLAVSGSEDSSVRLDSSAVHLSAGRERMVRARVRTHEAGTRTRVDRVRLAVAIDGDTARVEPAVSVVEVVPKHSVRASRFRRVPAELTVRQVDRAPRPVAELRGAGALTASGATQVEFLLRGLDQTASLFGEQDEYWLAVGAPRYRLRLGDRAAPYSRLGESWRSGTGAEGEVTVAGVRVGAFAQRDRRGAAAARSTERGASVEMRPWSRLLTEGRYVSRGGGNAADVWTARAQLAPWRTLSLDAELGRGHDSVGMGRAYAVAMTASAPRASVTLRRVAADSGFPGLTRGTTSSEAAATLVPVSRLSVSVSATKWTALRTRLLAGPSSTDERAVDGRVAWGQWLDAGYRRSIDGRTLFGVRRERRSRSARLSAGLPIGLATVRGGAEYGVTVVDDAPLDRIPFRRVDLRASVGRGANVVSASAEWLTGMSPSSWIGDDQLRAAVSAALPLTPVTRLALSLSATRHAGAPARAPIVLDVGLLQSLPFGQRASWRTRAMSYGPDMPPVRAAHQTDYTVPFGLPVGGSDASGTVRARVVDRETGRPLAGMLLRVGDRVRFTDADGAAAFDGLTEATQYVEVDRETLGADRVVVPAAVLGVTVHAGETKAVELGVARGAAIHGRLRRLDAAPSDRLGAPPALADSGTIVGTVLQLSNGSDSVRTVVDGWGAFGFGLVAPGRWVLSVVQADLPRYHRFEEDRVVLDLAPAEARDVLLRVTPSAPTIQMIAQAELTVEPPGSGRGTASSSMPRAVADPAGEQWSSSEPRSVPPPSGRDSAVARSRGDDGTHTPPWDPGLRRLVAPPSRAARGPVIRIVPPPGPVVRVVPPPVTAHHYTVTRWDVSLTSVARAMYGDESLWPKIWLANLDQLRDPDVIRPGQRLRIPDRAPLTDDERTAEEQYRARRP